MDEGMFALGMYKIREATMRMFWAELAGMLNKDEVAVWLPIVENPTQENLDKVSAELTKRNNLFLERFEIGKDAETKT